MIFKRSPGSGLSHARMSVGSRGYMVFEMFAIFVIAVVLTVVVFRAIMVAQRRSRDAKRMEDIGVIRKAIGVYQSDLGITPPGDGIELGTSDAKVLCDSGWSDKCSGKLFLQGVPRGRDISKNGCDGDADRYLYTQVDDGIDYRVVFCLEGELQNYKGGVHKATEAGVY